MKPDRAERLLDRVSGLDAKAESLLEASLLSSDAREAYRRILVDRARALQILD
jgi:uncharacterized membrane-anchored protein